MEPIPVICDRCRAEANAGEDPFTAIADSLAFEPVKRNRERVNGWSPDRQRAFIAALVLTGSPKQAAEAVERNAAGVDKLKQAADGASFAAACEAAIALHRERERFRLDQALAALARPRAASPACTGEGRGEGAALEPSPACGTGQGEGDDLASSSSSATRCSSPPSAPRATKAASPRPTSIFAS